MIAYLKYQCITLLKQKNWKTTLRENLAIANVMVMVTDISIGLKSNGTSIGRNLVNKLMSTIIAAFGAFPKLQMYHLCFIMLCASPAVIVNQMKSD